MVSQCIINVYVLIIYFIFLREGGGVCHSVGSSSVSSVLSV